MNIQEAIVATRKGRLIHRTSWNTDKSELFPVPHYQKHVALIEDEGNKRWIVRDQFMPGAFTWDHNFTVDEIMADDWEILEDACTCAQCDPQRYENDPLKIGDLIERWPCSGLRIIWVVDKIRDGYAYGAVYRIFDGEHELEFTIEMQRKPGYEPYPKIKILNPHNSLGYCNWISTPGESSKIADIYPGLMHHWPTFKGECRLTGERLEQLRHYETQRRIKELSVQNEYDESSDIPTPSRSVAASPRRQE